MSKALPGATQAPTPESELDNVRRLANEIISLGASLQADRDTGRDSALATQTNVPPATIEFLIATFKEYEVSVRHGFNPRLARDVIVAHPTFLHRVLLHTGQSAGGVH